MTKTFYDLNNLSTEEKEELFKRDTKGYMYSLFHNIVDTSFDLVETYEEDLQQPFHELLPFEVLTQVLNFITSVFDQEAVFERIHVIEEEFKKKHLFKIVQ